MNTTSLLTTPCEIAARKYVPAIRASVTMLLVKEYGLSTYRVAKLLGVTPAAISNYLLRRRGGELVDIIFSDAELRRKIQVLAERIAGGYHDSVELVEYVCEACRRLQSIISNNSSHPCPRG